MRASQSLFLALAALPAFITCSTDATPPRTTISSTSFGIDPLLIQSSGGNQIITSVIYDPANAHSGSGYMSITFPAVNEKRYVVFYHGFPADSGSKYTNIFFGKTANGNASECYTASEFRDNTGNVTRFLDNGKLTNEYKKYRLSANFDSVPKGDTGLSIFYVTCTPGGPAETVYIDDYALKVGE